MAGSVKTTSWLANSDKGKTLSASSPLHCAQVELASNNWNHCASWNNMMRASTWFLGTMLPWSGWTEQQHLSQKCKKTSTLRSSNLFFMGPTFENCDQTHCVQTQERCPPSGPNGRVNRRHQAGVDHGAQNTVHHPLGLLQPLPDLCHSNSCPQQWLLSEKLRSRLVTTPFQPEPDLWALLGWLNYRLTIVGPRFARRDQWLVVGRNIMHSTPCIDATIGALGGMPRQFSLHAIHTCCVSCPQSWCHCHFSCHLCHLLCSLRQH